MPPFTTAEQLAADLAGGSVDPNEAQKALAYLRSKRDPKAFFAYLNAIVKDGRVVIRSNQTLGYYREILAACQRHLKGMDYDEMVQTLGWALRLLRYYRNVPEAVRKAVEAEVPPAEALPVVTPPTSTTVSLSEPAPVKPKASDRLTQPAAPKKVGDIFTGNVLAVDKEIFLLELPGHPHVKVILKREPNMQNYQRGNPIRVVVVQVEERDNKIFLHVRWAKKNKE